MIKIPVRNVAKQKFSIEIEPESLIFNFDFLYNSRAKLFYMDLALGNDEVLKGIGAVSGIELLSQFNLIQGDLVVLNSAEYSGDPTLGSWDNATEMFYFEKSELEQLSL